MDVVKRIGAGLRRGLDMREMATLTLASVVEGASEAVTSWVLEDYENRELSGAPMRFAFFILLRGEAVVNVEVHSAKRLVCRPRSRELLVFDKDLTPSDVRFFRKIVLEISRNAACGGRIEAFNVYGLVPRFYAEIPFE